MTNDEILYKYKEHGEKTIGKYDRNLVLK